MSMKKWTARTEMDKRNSETPIVIDYYSGNNLYLFHEKLYFVNMTQKKKRQNWDTDDGTYFKSIYCWDIQGDPRTPEINPSTGEITDWKLKTENKSDYNIIILNNNISENNIYKLEANYFNWLAITEEFETNSVGFFFWRVRKIAKSDSYLRHVCPSVRM